jgi:isochorismate hydrolase
MDALTLREYQGEVIRRAIAEADLEVTFGEDLKVRGGLLQVVAMITGVSAYSVDLADSLVGRGVATYEDGTHVVTFQGVALSAS